MIGPAMLYAYAAIRSGNPYANFTPSLAADAKPLVQFARARNVAVAGKDGKTGQTVLKTVIAPALRHVDVQRFLEGLQILQGRRIEVGVALGRGEVDHDHAIDAAFALEPLHVGADSVHGFAMALHDDLVVAVDLLAERGRTHRWHRPNAAERRASFADLSAIERHMFVSRRPRRDRRRLRPIRRKRCRNNRLCRRWRRRQVADRCDRSCRP